MITPLTSSRTWLLGLILALAAATALSAAAPADAHHRKSRAAAKACAGATLVPAAGNIARVRKATLCLLNRERTKRRRKALRTSRTLQRVAVGYAHQMAQQDFFAHTSPSGSTMLGRIQDTSYLKGARSWLVGENLAWGSGSASTPRETVKGWMASPGHKRNILEKRFRHIGIGIALGAPKDVGGLPAATYTTEFGRR